MFSVMCVSQPVCSQWESGKVTGVQYDHYQWCIGLPPHSRCNPVWTLDLTVHNHPLALAPAIFQETFIS